MQIHEIKRDHSNKAARQVGRGGKRGKTSGRGGKGQTARAGNKRRPALRDMIKKIPKLRGRGIHAFKPIERSVQKSAVVNLSDLNILENGVVVNAATLVANGLARMRLGKYPKIKILGHGEITKKLIIESCDISATAKEKIEKAGGSVK